MPKKKKSFIDKKDPRTHTFSLVHRSQRDPLAADPDSNQLVLLPTLPSNSNNVEPKIPVEVDGELLFHDYANRPEKEKQYLDKADLADAGILVDPEDEYDYNQHLKVRRPEDDSNVYKADPKALVKVLEEKGVEPQQLEALSIPSEMLGSAFEEDIGLLNLAAPHSGPRLDWDPEVVAAMDDDFDFENESNQLLDNFMDLALADKLPENAQDGDEEDWETDEEYDGRSDAGSVDSLPDMFGNRRFLNAETETVKSRFTEYSMTSSILPRSDLLDFQDRRFEKMYEQYDEDNIGALDEQEETIGGEQDIDEFEGVLDEFLATIDKEQLPSSIAPKGKGQILDIEEDRTVEAKKTAAKTIHNILESSSGAGPAMLEIEEKKQKDWDCESILSTRSTLYNHPRRIIEESKKIKINKRTGLPLDSSMKKSVAENSLNDSDTGSDDDIDPENLGVARDRKETVDEKRARKQAIKEEKKLRRMQKKSTKTAFREEEKKQKKMIDSNPMAGRRTKTLA